MFVPGVLSGMLGTLDTNWMEDTVDFVVGGCRDCVAGVRNPATGLKKLQQIRTALFSGVEHAGCMRLKG